MLFADTTFLVAAFNADDENYRTARDELTRILRAGGREPPLVFTDYVFDELITALLIRARRHDLAARAGRALLEARGARMVPISANVFQAAWRLFLARPDKRWSFTDCTSFEVMKAMGIRCALSFDSDFEAAGFETRPA